MTRDLKAWIGIRNSFLISTVFWALVVGAILLTACNAPQVEFRTAVATCSAYAKTLKSLSAFKMAGNLTTSQIRTVDVWEPILTPICTRGTPPSGSEMATTLEAGMIALIAVEQGRR